MKEKTIIPNHHTSLRLVKPTYLEDSINVTFHPIMAWLIEVDDITLSNPLCYADPVLLIGPNHADDYVIIDVENNVWYGPDDNGGESMDSMTKYLVENKDIFDKPDSI